MKNYIRPVIEVADQLAEGVYMLSGDAEPVALSDALDAAINGDEDIENNDAGDLTGGNTETADATDTTGTTSGDIVSGGGVQGGDGTTETLTDQVEESAVIETANASGSTETPNETSSESQDTGVQEDVQFQNSMLITCDSEYMNGVWQGAREGAWGDMKLGCKEVWGCKECPADKGNGCGLQDANAVSLYFHKSGSLKPGWEAAGKLPTDSPYGF